MFESKKKTTNVMLPLTDPFLQPSPKALAPQIPALPPDQASPPPCAHPRPQPIIRSQVGGVPRGPRAARSPRQQATRCVRPVGTTLESAAGASGVVRRGMRGICSGWARGQEEVKVA